MYDPDEKRENKRRIEARNAELSEGVSGWFGLTSTAVTEHCELFGHTLKDDCPFVIFDNDPNVVGLIRKEASELNELHKTDQVQVIEGDLFEKLFKTAPVNMIRVNRKGEYSYRPSFYGYGHIDLFSTSYATKGLFDALHRMSTWWAIQDRFCLDITVSMRPDSVKTHELLFEWVRRLFKQAKWSENIEPIYEDYKDQWPMVNMFFDFQREVSKEKLPPAKFLASYFISDKLDRGLL